MTRDANETFETLIRDLIIEMSYVEYMWKLQYKYFLGIYFTKEDFLS